MAMTSPYPQGYPFCAFADPSRPSSSAITSTQGPCFNFGATSDSFGASTDIPVAHPMKRSVSAAGLVEESEPSAKRRVDRVSAHLKNFHISPLSDSNHEFWRSKQRQETFQEIEDRLSDSSEEEMKDDDVKATEEDEAVMENDADDSDARAKEVRLSELLREYIKRAHEQPVILPRPSDLALVPYVPRNPLDDPTMRGRINEISAEEANKIEGVGAVEPVPYVEDYVEKSEDQTSPSDSQSSTPLSIVELPDDSEFDMDVDFE